MAGRTTLPFFTANAGVSAPVSIYNAGTNTLATLYTDKTAGATAANPVVPDAMGNITFFAAQGDYDAAFSAGFVASRTRITVREDPQFGSGTQALTPGAGALAIDASLGSEITVSPSGNVTPTTFTNLQNGQRIILDFVSDGTHTFAYPTICKFAGGAASAASSTSGYRDRYEFVYNGTNLVEVARAIGIR
jgi:hypothetical protein